MKRIYIAAILLIFTAVVCFSEYKVVTKSAEKYIYEINKIENFYSDDMKNDALILTDNLSVNWQESSTSMDSFLFHEYVDDISSNIKKLKIYIEENDKSALTSTCEELKIQLESLKRSEFPTLYNII